MSRTILSSATNTAGFLAECVPFAEFCREFLKVTERTGQRLANEPDGLPLVKIGRKALVHLPTADAWAKRRQVQRNPIRRGKAG
jgi:hypothetical protein